MQSPNDRLDQVGITSRLLPVVGCVSFCPATFGFASL